MSCFKNAKMQLRSTLNIKDVATRRNCHQLYAAVVGAFIRSGDILVRFSRYALPLGSPG